MYTINNLFSQPKGKKDRIDKIVIPAIQRDYVQGLKEYSSKFDKFLDVLFHCLIGNNTISLDFIYGYFSNGIFNPIDGQQRITTLALLYYYIVTIRQKKYDNNIFKHISYETRETATKFCELLGQQQFTEYLNKNLNEYNISTSIKNYHQYYDIYDYDLTIDSIINALEKIEEKYNKYFINHTNNGIDILFDNINFNILPMENFSLSDDLYIKMNGRGKQLSNFDNFKADYFKWLEENILNAEDIKIKFNTQYIDIFWDFAVENNKDKLPDPESLFFRFINRFIIAKNDLSQNIIPDNFINDSEDLSYIYNSFEIYKNCFDNQNNHNSFINLLDNLTKINNIDDFFQPIWNIDENNSSKKFSIFDKLTYKDRFVYNNIMLFFEQENCITYINEAKKYSRIIWNITEQYFTLNEVAKNSYITAVNGMQKLVDIKYWDNIYKSFKEININNIESHMEFIVKDEQIKCQYIIKNNEYEEIFKELESLKYLHGILGFLLNEKTLEINDNVISISKIIFSNQNEYKLFVRALISQIDNINIIKTNTYKPSNRIKQLINSNKFRNIAKKILESINSESEIQNILTNLIKTSSCLKIDNIKEYKYFTALCSHESLYREENNINKYKIHLTDNSYWLMKNDYVMATTTHMRSYCPVRYKLINGLKIIASVIKENNNTQHYTKRNEDIYFLQNKFHLKFELNNIYINDYNPNHKISIHKFYDINANNIDGKVLGLYDYIIDYSKDFIELQNFFNDNKELFKDIITNGNILCYINPFDNYVK